MCGRTALTASPEDLREIFGLTNEPRFALQPHYNVTPSQPVAAVRVLRGAAGRTMESLRWGLVPFWADDPKVGHKQSLARVETVTTAPAYRDAIRKRRCLVVVDGFFEWKRDGKNPSQPFFIHRPDGAPLALAGVWDRWVSRDGEVLESCAILTQPARPPIDAVHDRMPLVLPPDAWDQWLDPALTDLSGLLVQRDAPVVTHPVSPYVNDPKHDDATCVQPWEPAQTRMF
jgi:putative SOS response-associated peptidase YedK